MLNSWRCNKSGVYKFLGDGFNGFDGFFNGWSIFDPTGLEARAKIIPMRKTMKRGRRARIVSDSDESAAEVAEKNDGHDSDSHESLPENDEVGEGSAGISSAPPPRARVSAADCAASHLSAAEISETVDDIMAISGEEAGGNNDNDEEKSRGSGSPAAGNSRRSASPAQSLTGIGMDHGAIVDEDFPAYFRRDVEKVSRFLRNLETQKCDISEKTHKDKRGTLTVQLRHRVSFDGVGKCLRIVPEGSMRKYTQPFEGFSWNFVSRCAFFD